jgi:hypothetical protein
MGTIDELDISPLLYNSSYSLSVSPDSLLCHCIGGSCYGSTPQPRMMGTLFLDKFHVGNLITETLLDYAFWTI